MRFKANPGTSLARVTGDCLISSIIALVFLITQSSVHSDGTISTSGTKYGGLTFKNTQYVNVI